MKQRKFRLTILSILLISHNSLDRAFAKTPILAVEDAGKGGTRASSEKLATIVVGDPDNDAAPRNLVNAVLTEMFSKDKDLVMMDAAYPGMQAAVGAALLEPLKKEVARINVQYRNDLAALYEANLSEADIQKTIEFYQGPAGSSFLRELQKFSNFSNIASELAAQKDASADALTKDQSNAGVRAIFALSPENRDSVVNFFSSAHGKSLASINEKKAAIDLKWSNYISPEAEKEVESAVTDAMISHVAKTDPATAKAISDAVAKDAVKAD